MTLSINGGASTKGVRISVTPLAPPVIVSASTSVLQVTDQYSVSPSSFTISGTNFSGMTSVFIGAADITSYATVDNSSQITVDFSSYISGTFSQTRAQPLVVTTTAGSSNTNVTISLSYVYN